MKACDCCGTTKRPAHPVELGGYQGRRFCPDCSSALLEGEVTARDTDGDLSLHAYLRSRSTGCVLAMGDLADPAIELEYSREEVAIAAIRLLFGLGAGNQDGEASSWPKAVPVPDWLRPQGSPAVVEAAWTPVALHLSYLGKCRECGQTLRLGIETGWVACEGCSPPRRFRVTVKVGEGGA